MQILLQIKNSITLYCGRDFFDVCKQKNYSKKANKKSIKNKPLKPIL